MAELLNEGGYDLTEIWDADGYPGVVLGHDDENRARGSVWLPQRLQGHALTFGATRSGKGVSAIIPALLTYSGSMVCIDPKGENCWTSSGRRRAMGHRVVNIDPWGEVNRRYAGGEVVEAVAKFNPLAVLNPTSPDFGDEVAAVADALITATGGDAHWSESARELVGGLVAAYVEARPGKANLRDVRRALLISQEDFGKLIEFFEAETPDGLGVRKLAGYKLGSREVDSIRSVAKTQTAFLDSEQLCANLEGEPPSSATGPEVLPPFDLSELATGQVTLYLVLPLDRLTTHGRWLRLILTLAIRAIAQQASPPALPVLFMLDEFGTIGRLAMVEQAFGLMAGVGIRIWGFLQDLNQLRRDYPDSWETFIANCAVLQMLNVRDATTSEYFSKFLGVVREEFVSKKQMEDRAKLSKEAKDLNYAFMPGTIQERPLIEPDRLRKLPHHKEILFYLGLYDIMQSRYSYYNIPQWVGKFRPIPQFANVRPEKPSIRTVDEAIELIKNAGFQIKTKMLGGWTITSPVDNSVFSASSQEALINYARTL